MKNKFCTLMPFLIILTPFWMEAEPKFCSLTTGCWTQGGVAHPRSNVWGQVFFKPKSTRNAHLKKKKKRNAFFLKSPCHALLSASQVGWGGDCWGGTNVTGKWRRRRLAGLFSSLCSVWGRKSDKTGKSTILMKVLPGQHMTVHADIRVRTEAPDFLKQCKTFHKLSLLIKS